MANLTAEQERINREHIAHQAKYQHFKPDCRECIRQRSWKPPTKECNWCDERLPVGDTDRAIRHNEYHLSHPGSITK